MRANPANIIETTLTQHPGANPGMATNAIMQALKQHGLHIVQDTTAGTPARRTKTATTEPKPKCQNPVDPHWMTDLVGGSCPTCGWRPTA